MSLNNNDNLETVKRQLRQEFEEIALNVVSRELDSSLNDGDDNPEGEPDDTPIDDPAPEPEPEPVTPKPFVDVKFRNVNKIFTRPTDSNSYGDILISSDGTTTVNVVGKIFDDRTNIESYKIRIKRID